MASGDGPMPSGSTVAAMVRNLIAQAQSPERYSRVNATERDAEKGAEPSTSLPMSPGATSPTGLRADHSKAAPLTSTNGALLTSAVHSATARSNSGFKNAGQNGAGGCADDEEGGGPSPLMKRLKAWGAVVLGGALLAVLLGAVIPGLARMSGLRMCSLPQDLSASGASGVWGYARWRRKLEKPLVIMLSSDGFRVDYYMKLAPGSNITRLRSESTVAGEGLIPPFPSVTFPSHYSMATGLHPAWHGIIENAFVDPVDPDSVFDVSKTDPVWWLGEPIWETVTKANGTAATMFWPGSAVEKGPWSCPDDRCFKKYDASIPYEERVDTVLEWVALPAAQRPSLITLYFEEPDHAGHRGGPDTPLITEALGRVDDAIGRLLTGLEHLGVLQDVHILMVSDHGMLSTCGERTVFLSDFALHLQGFSKDWLTFNSNFVGVLPPPDRDPEAVYREMASALPKIRNGDRIAIYRKAELPARFLLSDSLRVPPVVALVEEGYQTAYDEHSWNAGKCLGMHGYDNALASMRGIFMGRGPRFASGRIVPSFPNVEIYNVVADILGITPAPSNGSADFAKFLLLPE